MAKAIDLVGRVSGYLTVEQFAGWTPNGVHKLWWCRCVCGVRKKIYGSAIRTGITKSCGCKRVEMTTKAHITHGMAKTPTYASWLNMKARCTRITAASSKNYLIRGITVCDRWIHSFENFLADMGEKPEGFSLDRIDNDGDYTPSNCRWTDRVTQANNRRDNVRLTAFGKTLTLKQWSNITGLSYMMLLERVKRGWDPEAVVSEPPKSLGNPKVGAGGVFA